MTLATSTRALLKAGLASYDSTETTALLALADAYIAHRTGLGFYSSTPSTATEYADGADFYIHTKFKPIITITSLQEVNAALAVSQTYAAADYIVDAEAGLISLRSGYKFYPGVTFTEGEGRVKVVYTYGIPSTDSRYPLAVEAANLIVAANMLKQTGASKSYSQDGAKSYSIESLSYSNGISGPFGEKIAELQADAEKYLNLITGGWSFA